MINLWLFTISHLDLISYWSILWLMESGLLSSSISGSVNTWVIFSWSRWKLIDHSVNLFRLHFIKPFALSLRHGLLSHMSFKILDWRSSISTPWLSFSYEICSKIASTCVAFWMLHNRFTWSILSICFDILWIFLRTLWVWLLSTDLTGKVEVHTIVNRGCLDEFLDWLLWALRYLLLLVWFLNIAEI